MTRTRRALRAAIARSGYRVSSGPANRFDAMRPSLEHLRAAGFAPRAIVDVGAHVGEWARLARAIFPDARLHLVEPQPACAADLERVAEMLGRTRVHLVAATAPGVAAVPLIGAGTGAWIPRGGAGGGVTVPAATLDALVQPALAPGDRALLKIDAEGHELDVLAGANDLLRSVEAILVETHVFDTDGVGNPVFGDVLIALRARGFELFDVASLSARPRDNRLRLGDFFFVARDSALARDRSWT